jgi:hypothetical protein
MSAESVAIKDERRNLRRCIVRLFFPNARGQDRRTCFSHLHLSGGSEVLVAGIAIRNQRGWDEVRAGPLAAAANRLLTDGLNVRPRPVNL